ncbi:hypothetical protein JNUCC0626_47925 [Lentzea sp. JNUCC 0626]|uniref:hypothetical protein n=1 Tax=Lentzea sp. JNUCC 0626 TaxID=3367513 RepID=UPI0037486719
MKRIVHAGAALAFAVCTALASTPAEAAGTDQHFILFSNKSDLVMNACYTSYNGYGRELAHDCDQVKLRGQSTFWIPREATETRVTIADAGEQRWASNHPNVYDLCLRATRTATVHEAREQRCTPD